MVIRDLSQPQIAPPKSFESSAIPLALVTDRFVACVLDFLIISPVVTFFIATLLRDLKTILILDSDSPSANVVWFVVVLCAMSLSCLLQSLFLFFWQATPGQKFMQLQVISFPQWLTQRKRLTFGQAVMRSFGWWFGVFTFGIPFLETLGHPLRRAFHERMSDTMVISLKQEQADVPLAIESRYIGSTLWIFFGFLTLLGMTVMARAYKGAMLEGLTAGNKAYAQATCQEIPSEYKGEKRVDMAMALFMSDEADDACVYNEAQKLLWVSEGETKALAEVAMGLISDNPTEGKDYYRKACETSANSEACSLGTYLLNTADNRRDILRRAGFGLVASQVAVVREDLDRRDFVEATDLLKDLEDETPLKGFLHKSWVKAAWTVNEEVHSSRAPASADKAKLLEDFKERYQIK